MPTEILVRTILAGNSKSEYLLHENVASEKKLPVYGLAWAYCYSDKSNIQRPLASVNLGVLL